LQYFFYPGRSPRNEFKIFIFCCINNKKVRIFFKINIDLIEVLKEIEDDRDPQGREYKLWEVLLVSVLALLNNSKTYVDICTFAQTHLECLKAVFGLKWKRVPTASALRKIIVRQDPAEIEKAFRLFSTLCDKKTDESGLMKQICVDGKTLNGRFPYINSNLLRQAPPVLKYPLLY